MGNRRTRHQHRRQKTPRRQKGFRRQKAPRRQNPSRISNPPKPRSPVTPVPPKPLSSEALAKEDCRRGMGEGGLMKRDCAKVERQIKPQNLPGLVLFREIPPAIQKPP